MKSCTGRDLEQCETCKHNIENRPQGWAGWIGQMKPQLSQDESECVNYQPTKSAGSAQKNEVMT